MPTDRVFGFEPDESSYSLLLKNIETNGYGNMVALNQAVSNYGGHSTLAFSEFNRGVPTSMTATGLQRVVFKSRLLQSTIYLRSVESQMLT